MDDVVPGEFPLLSIDRRLFAASAQQMHPTPDKSAPGEIPTALADQSRHEQNQYSPVSLYLEIG